MTEKVTPNETKIEKPKGKITLIDLLMIVMIVGVIATIVLPLQNTMNNEDIVRSSFPIMETIVNANNAFRQSGWGINAKQFSDLDRFNLRSFDNSVYRFDITDSLITATSSSLGTVFYFTITDSSIVATTNNLGRTTKGYFFDTRDNRLRVMENSQDTIIDSWLPEVSFR